jgi:hypothetical protein
VIGGKKVLALIPARGGSRGIPRKNIKSLWLTVWLSSFLRLIRELHLAARLEL